MLAVCYPLIVKVAQTFDYFCSYMTNQIMKTTSVLFINFQKKLDQRGYADGLTEEIEVEINVLRYHGERLVANGHKLHNALML